LQTGTFITTNAFGQKNKVPQEAVPDSVQQKVRTVPTRLNGPPPQHYIHARKAGGAHIPCVFLRV